MTLIITFWRTICRIWLFICCKTKLIKKNLLKKYLRFFTKYTLFKEKDLLGKKFYNEKFFYWKKTFFYRGRYKWKCKKYIYIIPKIYFYTENVKFFLNIYSFCKKNFYPKKYLLRLRWELNTLVLKVLEEANQWYS